MASVLGFMFTEDKQFSVLVLKARPDWQQGRVNGVGGSVQDGETPVAAMVRTFLKETGVSTTEADWTEAGTVGDIKVFTGVSDNLAMQVPGAEREGDERVDRVPVRSLLTGQNTKMLDDIGSLVSMALESV